MKKNFLLLTALVFLAMTVNSNSQERIERNHRKKIIMTQDLFQIARDAGQSKSKLSGDEIFAFTTPTGPQIGKCLAVNISFHTGTIGVDVCDQSALCGSPAIVTFVGCNTAEKAGGTYVVDGSTLSSIRLDNVTSCAPGSIFCITMKDNTSASPTFAKTAMRSVDCFPAPCTLQGNQTDNLTMTTWPTSCTTIAECIGGYVP